MSWYASHENLDSLLAGAVDLWAGDRITEWETEGIDPEVLKIIDKLARSMFESSKVLVSTDDLRGAYRLGNRPSEVLRMIDALDLATERIQEALAWEFCVGTKEMAERVLQLSDLVVTIRPGDQVLRYLRRLGRCYIAGFLPECVMICRAVLENALNDKYATKDVPVPSHDDGKTDLREKIDGAVFLKWLTPSLGRMAQDTRIRGNKAIHNDPDAVQDVLGTISATSAVLMALYGS